MTELPVGHVAVVAYNFAYMLWRHIFLLRVHKAKLTFLTVALCLQLLPFTSCKKLNPKIFQYFAILSFTFVYFIFHCLRLLIHYGGQNVSGGSLKKVKTSEPIFYNTRDYSGGTTNWVRGSWWFIQKKHSQFSTKVLKYIIFEAILNYAFFTIWSWTIQFKILKTKCQEFPLVRSSHLGHCSHRKRSPITMIFFVLWH